MATKPGPALALAALAALFLFKKKGGGAGGGGSTVDDPNDAKDGDKVDDDAPKDPPGTPSGGGTKVPTGTGSGGGNWKGPTVGPLEVWISPDCQTVIEGTKFFDDVVVPRFVEAYNNIDDLEYMPEGSGDELTILEGRYVDPFTILGAALNLKTTFDDGTVEFTTGPFMYTPPHSCAAQFPGFHIWEVYNGLQTNADSDRFSKDMDAYAEEYPKLSEWLLGLELRLFADPVASDSVAARWVFAD